MADKFSISGFSPLPSRMVSPLRAAECPIQVEARLMARHEGRDASAPLCFELRKLMVHANVAVVDRENRIDIDAWSPLFYAFRHYFSKGDRLGRSFRARY